MDQDLLIVDDSRTHFDTSHPVGLLWTSDRRVAGTSTWLTVALTKDRHPCPHPAGLETTVTASERLQTPDLEGAVTEIGNLHVWSITISLRPVSLFIKAVWTYANLRMLWRVRQLILLHCYYRFERNLWFAYRINPGGISFFRNVDDILHYTTSHPKDSNINHHHYQLSSASPCQYHSHNGTHPFIHIPSTLDKLINWQRR